MLIEVFKNNQFGSLSHKTEKGSHLRNRVTGIHCDSDKKECFCIENIANYFSTARLLDAGTIRFRRAPDKA